MSSHLGIATAVARTFDRAGAPPPARDANSADPATTSGAPPFAALLHAALATRTAARPLTQPTAAESTVDDTAGEQSASSVEAQGSMVESTDANDAVASGTASDVASTDVAAGAPASTVHRGLDGLVPEMRERLERVLDRMRDEYGYDVRVSETYRTQARQDVLHAQGRSAPGPVVTWTRRSNHTLGRAADIVVNGGYDDMKGYATLQRVAREEGLHTLGMRDPGHVELPRGAGVTGTSGMVDLAEVGRIAPDARVRVTEVSVQRAAEPAAVAQVAAVAPVARPANVARVAQVARVATPGAPSRTARNARTASDEAMQASSRASGTASHASATPAVASNGGDARLGAAGARAGVRPDTREGSGAEHGAAEEGGIAADAAQGERFGGAQHSAAEQARGGAPGARAESVHAATGVDALARMDAIAALRDGVAARPLSHLTLTVDDGMGGADRIRVDARGGTVGVTLDLSDAAAADRVGARIGELQQALEQRGLETDALRVRGGAATVPESIEMSRVAAGTLERESARGGSHSGQQHGQPQGQQDHHASRERDGRAPYDDRGYDDQRRDPSSRQRSRQEHKEADK